MIVTDEMRCWYCGNPATEVHHCLYGTANRAKAEKYGLTVRLCKEHHTGKTGVHMNPNTGLDLHLKKMAQEYFEEHYGDRELFIKEFGKSYL